ncbi:MAG TPA: VanZ family protein [Chitinispirillaceae bacterium]|nr:VanZ family protein [Chitinispirillaceae bacterium]
MRKIFSELFYPVFLMMILLILFVGLFPFNFREKNQACINTSKQLICFKKPSFALISPIPEKLVQILNKPFTVQIRLKTFSLATRNVPHIFSIFNNNSDFFTIGQWKSGVLFQFNDIKTGYKNKFGYKDAFKSEEPVMLTLCCSRNETVLFKNDKIVHRWNKPIVINNLSEAQGIILGNSSDGTGSWNGQIYEITFYDRFLSQNDITNHYQFQSSYQTNDSLFDDKTDKIFTVSFDKSSSAILSIPQIFRPPVLSSFTPPWVDFRFNHSYISDVIVNLLGFIPFGALLCYLLFIRMNSCVKSVAVSGLICAFISFTIEFLQIYLPFRSSQLSDLILNTLGGLIGSVVICLIIISYKDRLQSEPD